jgi:hypothetical protein
VLVGSGYRSISFFSPPFSFFGRLRILSTSAIDMFLLSFIPLDCCLPFVGMYHIAKNGRGLELFHHGFGGAAWYITRDIS